MNPPGPGPTHQDGCILHYARALLADIRGNNSPIFNTSSGQTRRQRATKLSPQILPPSGGADASGPGG